MSTDSSKPKGSAENPYTREEYERILESGPGNWKGGYVEGMGYVWAEIVIDEKGSSSSSKDEGSGSGPVSSDDGSFSHTPPVNPNASDYYGSTNNNGSPSPGGSTTGGGGNSGNTGGGNNTSNNTTVNVTFKGFNPNDKTGCFNRCKEMLSSAGCSLSGKEILMANYDSNHRATTPACNFEHGINYIDNQLRLGKPVIVAVDYKNGTSMGGGREDQSGDHFVIIVGGNRSGG